MGGIASTTGRFDELLSLADAAARRDPAATSALVTRVAPSMLRVVRAVLGRAHPDVDDVAQDAVIAFLSSLCGFRADSTVLYYADRVALLTALAARRKQRGRARFWQDGELADDQVDEKAPSPLATLIANRRRELLLRLLDELPAPTAEALGLHFILGHTVEEIAGAARVPVNTVWSRLRLGKEAIRRRFERDRQLADLMRGAG
jgi:RNA polymerase sigma-70 factor (ECF subfamily)